MTGAAQGRSFDESRHDREAHPSTILAGPEKLILKPPQTEQNNP
jgi:hypothetical protein